MAYITGQTPQGCCLPVKYLGEGVYECAPDVGELHRKHRIYNDYHMWYVKVSGQVGENVTVHLKWPQFDPEAVSEEYKKWDSYSADWPSFFATVPEVVYYSTDEVHWTRIQNAYIEGDTVIFSFDMTADTCFLSTTLHYTPSNFADLIKAVTPSPYVQTMRLCTGWDGGDVMTFVATDFSVPAEQKKTVYLQGAQHCHEHTGCHVCDFMLRYFAQPDEQAKAILKKCIFRITPIIDRTGWQLGWQTNPQRVNSLDFNYNRDWGVFTLPETKATADYLAALKAKGEQFAFLADIHGGTGDENDYSSGAGIAYDDRAPLEVLERQAWFVDMVRAECDYLNPADTDYHCSRKNDQMFTAYANARFGPAFTFEVSMSKIWDRAAKRRFPNSQFAYKRFAEQLARVIAKFAEGRSE